MSKVFTTISQQKPIRKVYFGLKLFKDLGVVNDVILLLSLTFPEGCLDEDKLKDCSVHCERVC